MERGRLSERLARVAGVARAADGHPRLLRTARAARRLLPGDSAFGDPLSTAGDRVPQAVGRGVAALTDRRPSVAGELGLGALQMWQSLAEAQGRGRGDRELAILFTDLVGFSAWALQTGDTTAVALLREVGLALEPEIERRDGRVVKRLGDGLMAVFPDAPRAVDAAHAGMAALGQVEVGGHRPRLRAGIHVGRPRRLGGDYLGVDVNIAARVADAARGQELLVSDAARAQLDEAAVTLRRRWWFRAKGAPRDLDVYTVRPPG